MVRKEEYECVIAMMQRLRGCDVSKGWLLSVQSVERCSLAFVQQQIALAY